MPKHKMCPKCLTHIVRFGAGPKEQCFLCDPAGETRRKFRKVKNKRIRVRIPRVGVISLHSLLRMIYRQEYKYKETVD